MSLMGSFGSARYTTKHSPEGVPLSLKVGRDLNPPEGNGI